MALLAIRDLSVHYESRHGAVAAVDRVTLSVRAGEAVAVVGESGCGKSTLALSLLRLLPTPPARIKGGEVLFEGESVLSMPSKRLRQIRGARIGLVLQSPSTALNPVYRVGDQVVEAICQHQSVSPGEAHDMAVAALAEVRIADAALRARAYPHELSGGMQQRVLLALALSCQPALLIADEPTAALDVTVQAEILALLRQAQHHRGFAVLLVTHDLSLVPAACDRVVVLYAGRVVEVAGASELLDHARHPYTHALVRALPSNAVRVGRLRPIPGPPPNRMVLPEAEAGGCPFRPRCDHASKACSVEPAAVEVGPEHQVFCHHPIAEDPEGGRGEGPQA